MNTKTMNAKTMRKREAAERRGRAGESLAALWLRLKGYRILARRVKTHAGEIDLVAAAPFGPVCFIEVKARAHARLAAESVADGQRTRIARAANLYLAARPALAGRGMRFDIVALAPRRLPVHHRDAWRPDF
jgi:putative endonuclease